MRTSALVRLSTGLVALLATSLLSAAPATADGTPAPVVVDDVVTLYPGQTTELDVLANDSSPSGDDLALCRFPEPDFGDEKMPPYLVMETGSMDPNGKVGGLVVMLMPRAHGTYVVDYYVCDDTHLVAAHLTIEVLPVSAVKVRKVPGKPGRLRVTNTNAATIGFWYGDRRAVRPDGAVRIKAGATTTVTVRRHKIIWLALIGISGGKAGLLSAPGIADHGVVKNIRLRPGTELPPPKPQPDYRARSWTSVLR